MTLNPQVKDILDMMESRGLPAIEEQTVQDARNAFLLSCKTLNKIEKMAKFEDRKIKGFREDISIRIYSPETDDQSIPALVYYHGGGWVIGNIETHDALCHTLAVESGCKVISVDYTLAPEGKFPVAVEDAYIAVKWVADHADELGIQRDAIAVGGDSAGGNLAAVVCYLANERNAPSIAYQVLLYPSTTFDLTESYEKYGEGYYLTKATMKWFREHYLNSEEDTLNPLAAPLLIPEEATKLLPPALIVTAEYDPLVDGGEAYANKLKAAGIETKYVCYPGMIHGFISMSAFIDHGAKAIKEIANELKGTLANKIFNKTI